MLLAVGATAPAFGAERASTDDLAERGVSVSWPIAASTAKISPGSKLRVTFDRQGRGRPRSVDVRVVRLSRSGRRLHTLRRQRLRHSGKVVVKLPQKMGRRYLVSVRTGKVRSRTVLRTGIPLPVAPPPVVVPAAAPAPVPLAEDGGAPPVPEATPVPVAPPAPVPTCNFVESVLDLRRPTAALHIAQGPARAGEARTYEIENTSQSCVFGGAGYYWERFLGERWGVERWMSVPHSPVRSFPPDVTGLPAGQRWSGTAVVPDNAIPGRYRLTVLWFVAGSLRAQIDVVS